MLAKHAFNEISATKISEADYLAREMTGEIRHEYVDGVVYAMAGAGENHNLVSRNILVELSNQLKQQQSPCKTLSESMKIRISNKSTQYFYPDVLVFCENHPDDTDYYKHAPILIVEVLSKSTRKQDRTSKKLAYFNIPSLQEFVLIEQDFCEVEVFRRKAHWQSTVYILGDTILFESIGVAVAVEDIYYQVSNADTQSDAS